MSQLEQPKAARRGLSCLTLGIIGAFAILIIFILILLYMIGTSDDPPASQPPAAAERVTIPTWTPTPQSGAGEEPPPQPPTPTPSPPPPPSAQAPIVVPAGQKIERGGMSVEIISLALFPPKHEEIEGWFLRSSLEDAQAAGALEILIENTGSQKITIYADRGVFLLGQEQMDPFWTEQEGEDLGGEIFPGIRRQGTIYFGIWKTPYSQLSGKTLLYSIERPYFSETYDDVADQDYEFRFTIP